MASRALKNLPNDTAKMRKILDDLSLDRLKYLAICALSLDGASARQRYKAKQVKWASRRREKTVFTDAVRAAA